MDCVPNYIIRNASTKRPKCAKRVLPSYHTPLTCFSIAMHEEKSNKHTDDAPIPEGAVPAYLLDREGVNRAKVHHVRFSRFMHLDTE